jgi:hypothetical protein
MNQYRQKNYLEDEEKHKSNIGIQLQRAALELLKAGNINRLSDYCSCAGSENIHAFYQIKPGKHIYVRVDKKSSKDKLVVGLGCTDDKMKEKIMKVNCDFSRNEDIPGVEKQTAEVDASGLLQIIKGMKC